MGTQNNYLTTRKGIFTISILNTLFGIFFIDPTRGLGSLEFKVNVNKAADSEYYILSVGETLSLFCKREFCDKIKITREKNNTNYTLENLVDKECEFNYTKPNITTRDSGMYVCEAENKKNKTKEYKTINIGYKPKEMFHAFDCKSYGHEKMSCNWCNENEESQIYKESQIHTNWTLKYIEDGHIFKECNKSKTTNKTNCSCTWNSFKHPKIYLKLAAKNGLGEFHKTATIYVTKIIIPKEIENVNMTLANSTCMTIKWEYPSCKNYIGEYVDYEVELEPEYKDLNIVTKNFTHPRTCIDWHKKIFCGLNPFTEYLFKIRSKLYDGKYWSNWSKNFNFFTGEDVPTKSPETRCSSYQISDERVKLYYKPLNKRNANGNIILVEGWYKVKPEETWSVVKCNMTESRCDFPNLKEGKEYEISIKAETKIGIGPGTPLKFTFSENKDTSIKEIQKKQNKVENIYNLKLANNNKQDTTYVIYYRPMCQNCTDGKIDWKEMKQIKDEVNITLPKRGDGYEYEVAVATERKGQKCSAMSEWRDSTYKISTGGNQNFAITVLAAVFFVILLIGLFFLIRKKWKKFKSNPYLTSADVPPKDDILPLNEGVNKKPNGHITREEFIKNTDLLDGIDKLKNNSIKNGDIPKKDYYQKVPSSEDDYKESSHGDGNKSYALEIPETVSSEIKSKTQTEETISNSNGYIPGSSDWSNSGYEKRDKQISNNMSLSE